MKKLFTILFPPLFGLILSLILVEGAVRAWGYFAKPAPVWSDRPPYYFQAESAETLGDYRYPPEKAPGGYRISVVGDSYSFAPYMQFTDAFPKVLERMLNLNEGVQRAEVINHGVPAYSTSHEVEPARKAVREQSDVVLLQITLNDPELKALRPIGITQFNTWGPLQPTGWKKTVLDHWKTAGLVANRLHNEKTRREYVKYFLDLFENPRSYSVFEKSVREIKKVTDAGGSKLVAVVFPLFGVPLDDAYPFRPAHDKVAALMAAEGIPLLDLFDLYKGIPLHRMQVIPDVDRHPNEIAHRMAAERIYSWLVGRGLVPEAFRIRKRFVKRTQTVKEEPFQGH